MNLKHYRCKKGYTQSEIADFIGVSSSAYAMYERGEREPSIELLYKLSLLLDTNMYSLCGFDSSDFQEKSSPDEPKLSEGEKMLVDMFRAIPEEQQRVFLEMGRVYADSLKKD